MNKIYRTLAMAGLIGGMIGSASAGTITQTFTIPLTGSLPTDVNDAQSDSIFNDFGYYLMTGAVAAGNSLMSVTLGFTGTETLQSLTLDNNSSTSQAYKLTATGDYTIDSGVNTPGCTPNSLAPGCTTMNGPASIPTVDLNNLDSAGTLGAAETIYGLSSFQAIAPGASQQFFPLPGGCTVGQYLNEPVGGPNTCVTPNGVVSNPTGVLNVSGSTGVASVNPYIGTSCSSGSNPDSCKFDLAYNTTTTVAGTNAINLLSAGNQSEVANGTFTVTFVYGPSGTPEPGTMLLFGAGLVGLGLIRKRLPRRQS